MRVKGKLSVDVLADGKDGCGYRQGDCYIHTFIASNSAINFLSPADAATVAFFGASLTTDAFLAKPRVAKVYLRYVTSGRIAQKR